MATKKKAAPAEEVQNTQEGIQNGAQCVETPEPIEEPTPNEITPETAENDAGEAQATPLTLEVNIYWDNGINELTEPLCFVEFNPEKHGNQRVCIGAYRAEEEDTIYYGPYFTVERNNDE